jgi:hypothetical protein
MTIQPEYLPCIREIEMHEEFWSKNLKARGHINTNLRIILKWLLTETKCEEGL